MTTEFVKDMILLSGFRICHKTTKLQWTPPHFHDRGKHRKESGLSQSEPEPREQQHNSVSTHWTTALFLKMGPTFFLWYFSCSSFRRCSCHPNQTVTKSTTDSWHTRVMARAAYIEHESGKSFSYVLQMGRHIQLSIIPLSVVESMELYLQEPTCFTVVIFLTNYEDKRLFELSGCLVLAVAPSPFVSASRFSSYVR